MTPAKAEELWETYYLAAWTLAPGPRTCQRCGCLVERSAMVIHESWHSTNR